MTVVKNTFIIAQIISSCKLRQEKTLIPKYFFQSLSHIVIRRNQKFNYAPTQINIFNM